MASILIIESDAPFARRLSWILLEAGYDVAICNSPVGAADCLSRSSPDVIIVGEETEEKTVDRYRALFNEYAPDAGVLDLSNNPGAAGRRALQPHAHLRQPFDADDLLEEVNGLLTRTR